MTRDKSEIKPDSSVFLMGSKKGEPRQLLLDGVPFSAYAVIRYV